MMDLSQYRAELMAEAARLTAESERILGSGTDRLDLNESDGTGRRDAGEILIF